MCFSRYKLVKMSAVTMVCVDYAVYMYKCSKIQSPDLTDVLPLQPDLAGPR